MNVKNFVEQWRGRGKERGDSQPFWLDLLRQVFDVDNPSTYIRFENPVRLENKSFIDAYIDATHVLIEQKSITKDLSESIRQSDGTMLTPYQQAKRYAAELPYSKRPRWIIACNFKEFHVYDMEKPHDEPEIILLENLPREYHRLQFLIDQDFIKIQREVQISIKAGEIVGKIYDALLAQYFESNSDESLKSLNKLCVRLVFCLYAESTGVFGKHKIFRDYLAKEVRVRQALIDLFAVLNTPTHLRDRYLEKPLADFPYVNGGLFDGNIEIPNFTNSIKDLLIQQASSGFNWSDISPTIFGAVFESTLNPVTRRSGGMHYTSIENIHKVIDPLFLDDLREEFERCHTKKKLLAFQDKLASLKFFDPACGSGNFLTETYLSLRRLENDVLKKLLKEQVSLGELDNPIKVSITQFFGIEINDFAVSVAKTALWISELQMMEETAEIIHRDIDLLPLKTNANIYEGNALRADWNLIAPSVDYIMGNPPFVGRPWRTPQQVDDMDIAFYDLNKHGYLDYVCAWYNKAADYINNTKTEAALVSTNSICQGESVSFLWRHLFGKGIVINFAHRSFLWDSESTLKAHVHCVVIGFAKFSRTQKFIFDGDKKITANNINGYLMDAPNFFVENRGKPPKGMQKMVLGNIPWDGGNLLLRPDEKVELISKNPLAEKFIKQFVGADELIHNKLRYCLWLVDATPHELNSMPLVIERLKRVTEVRRNTKTRAVRLQADTPALFSQIRPQTTDFLAIPRISSNHRKYIPIDFMTPDVIVSDQIYTIPNATMYLFGVLESIVHMAWNNVVCGRLGNGFRYSPYIYYNFPFCNPTAKQRSKIEQTAQRILSVRADFPDSTLADLYSETTMPAELRKAHEANDRAVMQAYGFGAEMSEGEIVAELMGMYQELANA